MTHKFDAVNNRTILWCKSAPTVSAVPPQDGWLQVLDADRPEDKPSDVETAPDADTAPKVETAPDADIAPKVETAPDAETNTLTLRICIEAIPVPEVNGLRDCNAIRAVVRSILILPLLTTCSTHSLTHSMTGTWSI